MINKKIETKFIKIKLGLNLNQYTKIFKSIILALTLFFTIISFGIFNNYLYSGIILLVIPILGYFFYYYYPYLLKKNYLGQIEKELPFFLIDLDMHLSIGEEFLSAIKKSSLNYKYLKDIIHELLNEYNNGISIQKCIRDISENYNSKDFRRALKQILNIYESGKIFDEKGPLFELAEELISIQTTSTKLYSNKLVMVSLLFIGITAILPALLLVFVNIGSLILDLGITPNQVIILFVVIFPAIDLILIFIILNMMPGFMR